MRRPSQSSEESISIRSWTVPDEWHDSDAGEVCSSSSSSMSIPNCPLAPSLGGSGSDIDVTLDVDDMMPSLVEQVSRMLGHC